MMPVADTTVATADLTAGKRAAIVGNMESVAINEAMTETAATIGGDSEYFCGCLNRIEKRGSTCASLASP